MTRISRLLLTAALMGALPSCDLLGGIIYPVNRVTESLDRAIAELGNQSSSWQLTLRQLQTDLVQQGQQTLANEVQSVLNRGIAAAGLEVKCSVSFLKDQLRAAVEEIKARFQGTPIPPPPPHFCSVDPATIDLRLTPDRRPATLNVYGFNLSLDNVIPHVVQNDGGLSPPVAGYFNVPSEFMATLNIVNYPFTTSSSSVRFSLRSGEMRTVGIVQAPSCGQIGQACCTAGTACTAGSGCLSGVCTTCPPPYVPPTPITTTLVEETKFDGNNCFGVNNVHRFGGPCSSGTHREQCQVTLVNTNSNGTSCRFEQWLSTNVRDCTCAVRFISDADCFHGITCRIKVTQTTDTPPPPTRPIGCP